MSLEQDIKNYNDNIGDLGDYDCPICKNKGYIAEEYKNELSLRQCECMKIRNAKILLRKSGMQRMTEKFRFDNFTTNEQWQEYIKQKAQEYLEQESWFFIGGQIGSGKTHLCSAIVGEMINNGVETIYMLWRDSIVNLKSNANTEEYNDLIYTYKHAKALYIDDFFKSQSPTVADLNIAFEIINYRYLHDLTTIISSEYTIDELSRFDEAISSRIIEKAENYLLAIGKDEKKNIRLKGE